MSTLTAIYASIPDWAFALGWLSLLLGWVLARPATQRIWSKVVVIGIANTTTNTVLQNEAASQTAGDSALSKVGSWCSVIGLVLTLQPLLEKWLK